MELTKKERQQIKNQYSEIKKSLKKRQLTLDALSRAYKRISENVAEINSIAKDLEKYSEFLAR